MSSVMDSPAPTTTPRLFDLHMLDGAIYSGGWVKGDSRVDVVEPATGAVLAGERPGEWCK